MLIRSDHLFSLLCVTHIWIVKKAQFKLHTKDISHHLVHYSH